MSMAELQGEDGKKPWERHSTNILARCIRVGKSYLFKLRDVRGAFTNVTHKSSVMHHLEVTQSAPEAVIHHSHHVNTILRRPGCGDWKIAKGTRQRDLVCDVLLGFFDSHTAQKVCEQPSANK